VRIVFLGKYNSSDYLTGPEKVAKSIFKEVCKYNHDTSFVEYYFDGKKHSLLKKIFGNEVIKDGNLIIFRKGLIPILVYLIAYKPEIIHCITFERFQIVAFVYRLISKCRIIYNVHGIIAYENTILKKNVKPFYKLKDKFLERCFYKYSAKILFLSHKSIELAKMYYKFDESKIIIIANGFDKDILEIKHAAHNPNEILNAVFVGDKERPEKGFDFLFAGLEKIKIPMKLYIIGNYKDNSLVDNKNIQIEYLEKMTNRNYKDFLQDKDIFISASFYEPFSISVLEAIAVGLVPVITKETGISEYLENGLNGFIFNYSDYELFVEIFEKINNDREYLVKVSNAAKEFASNMTWPEIVSKYYIPLYQDISNQK